MKLCSGSFSAPRTGFQNIRVKRALVHGSAQQTTCRYVTARRRSQRTDPRVGERRTCGSRIRTLSSMVTRFAILTFDIRAPCPGSKIQDRLILSVDLLTTVAALLGSGGTKVVVAGDLLLKRQLLVVTHGRRRAPNLSIADRFLMGFWSLFPLPGRIAKVAVSIRPSTL